MNNEFLKPKHGFTLIEIMLVIVIVLIMTGVIFSSQNEIKEVRNVEIASRQVASQLRSLQNDSLNGRIFDTDSDGIGDKNACKYEFNATGSVYDVKYYENCSTPALIATNVFDLTKKGVDFELPISLYFSAPRGNADSAKTIVIRSVVKPSVKRWVCVSAGGSVTEEKTVCP